MKINFDFNDQKQSIKIAAGFIILIIALSVLAYIFIGPAVIEFSNLYLAPGVGVKTAAIASFSITFITLIVFALFAGDGLIGELQFMLIGFFAFFLIFWFLIAWIF